MDSKANEGRMTTLEQGDWAPDFSLTDLDGNNINSQISGVGRM